MPTEKNKADDVFTRDLKGNWFKNGKRVNSVPQSVTTKAQNMALACTVRLPKGRQKKSKERHWTDLKSESITQNVIKRLIFEAVDESMQDGMGDPSLSINNLEQFNNLIYSLETFANQFEHPLWDALAEAIMDTISHTPEYMALEKAIEPSF